MPSTRYKDLVDLVAIVTSASVDADAQIAALRSEIDRREIAPVPKRFAIPDRQLWEVGYANSARDSVLVVGRKLDEALAIVTPFVDPVFQGTATGSGHRAASLESLTV